jgi:succinoglycan biosynthesis transport protein ExoP
MGAIRSEISTTNNASVELRDLMRDVEANRGIYEAALARSRELNEQRRLNASNTRVISRATPPLDSSGPPAPLVLIASLLFGFAAGCTLAWLRDQLGYAPRPRVLQEAARAARAS